MESKENHMVSENYETITDSLRCLKYPSVGNLLNQEICEISDNLNNVHITTDFNQIEDLNETLNDLDNGHYKSGRIYQRAARLRGREYMETNEIEAIYYLVESHIPSLRIKTVLRYEKILTLASHNAQLSLSKSDVAISCKNTKIQENVSKLLDKIQEMPSEWTLVQLTPHFNPQENRKISIDDDHTNSLYVTVFNCGHNQFKPFCVNIEAPRDSVNGNIIDLIGEMHTIIQSNKDTLSTSRQRKRFKGIAEKQDYFSKRQAIDDRLKLLVKDLQNLYLKEWKCFLIGKYVDSNLENKIQKRLKDFFNVEAPSYVLNEKMMAILHYLTKSVSYLKLTELRNAVQTTIPASNNKKLQKNLVQFIRSLHEELKLNDQKRHPLILILDDSLDCFPWEMMEILVDVPVSRLPSVHLAYAIFKQNKDSIKNGVKIVENPNNGTFVVNPDLDLTNMQNRIMSFYEYWLPKWKGVASCKPTQEEFEKMLVSGDIFAYNGHGNGSHFFPLHKIERIRINAVVLLFGCGSTKLNVMGPQTEMYSAYQMYLIACSPCIVGSLWEITDLDTDILTTEFLSLWIPNPKRVHWKNLDKNFWKKGNKVDFTKESPENTSSNHPHEPELLKALSISRKSNSLNFYTNRAAIVARGIPTRIVSK